jgi:predicted Rdx family selenoprotein
VSAEIVKVTGAKVRLIAGSGGIFEIRKDGKTLWKKHRGGAFPLAAEIRDLFTSQSNS